MTAIQINSLRKEYGDTVAVDDLSLEVSEGEIFGFLGPNGAGKSTTIDVLLNYAKPTAGSVRVLGYDATAESRAVRQHVGVLPDGYDIYDRLTAREHIELAIRFKGAEDDPMTVLKRVGIADAADRDAGGFSKGMTQRLVLGMALVGSPSVLVFDEPSSGLDPTGITALREIAREEADRGATVFFSSHDLSQVEAVCDRVAIIDQGKLLAVDTVDGLRDRIGSTATLSVSVTPVPEAETVSTVDGVTSVNIEDDRVICGCSDGATKIRVLDAIRDAGSQIEDFETTSASLEDLYAATIDGSGATMHSDPLLSASPSTSGGEHA
ncbi:ABC transporter ATP-binding protein [Haloarchaeobius amylolyticus]|uniref:ABC transporter ATP-binding protein n=1 Tax=Haloarchaeobius amylolyticus TaxID=1198296 RepID=UPI002271C594|nr:ABC transporter ATP-binding protein [Haloarchaeobius amylolyticus]